MAGHTPGPWREGPTEGIGQRGKLIVVDADGLKVCDCESNLLPGLRFARPYPEDTANAKLIAASPELLAALKVTLNYWTSTGFAECEPGCDCIVESVRAAIAKAEADEPAPAADAVAGTAD
jgi:hypothetical protein